MGETRKISSTEITPISSKNNSTSNNNNNNNNNNKQKRLNTTHERKIGRGFEEEMEEQSNAWAVHKKYG
jgi:hypothetical protein